MADMNDALQLLRERTLVLRAQVGDRAAFDMLGLVIFGFAWAGAYGHICYTALNASRPVPTARPHLMTTEIGTGQRERNPIGL